MQKILITLAFCLCSFSLWAQRGGERVKAMRVAFITEELDLSVEEAKLFWPIFNEFEGKRKEIGRFLKEKPNLEEMTDAEAEVFMLKHFEREQKMLDLKKAYFEKFKAALPTKKLVRLPHVEHKFRKELLRHMKQRRGRGMYDDDDMHRPPPMDGGR